MNKYYPEPVYRTSAPTSSAFTYYFNLNTKRWNKRNSPLCLPIEINSGNYIDNKHQAYNFEYITIPMGKIVFKKNQRIIGFQYSIIETTCPVCNRPIYKDARTGTPTRFHCPECNSIIEHYAELMPEENQSEEVLNIIHKGATK